MHYSSIQVLFATIFVALPVISVPTANVDKRGSVTLSDSSVITIGNDGPNPDKRAVQDPSVHTRRTITTSDGMIITIGNSTAEDSKFDTRNFLEKRKSDYVSSCGPKSGWTPINDHSRDGTKWWGYRSAINAICTSMSSDVDGNPVVVGPGQYAAGIRRYEFESSSSGMRVALKNEIPGHIAFEVHNKQKDGDHKVDRDSCMRYLMAMTDPDSNGSNCYGKNNHDTKGGTWQIGNKAISYHALPASN